VLTAFDDIRFSCQRCGACCHHKRPQEFEDLVPLDRLPEFWEKSNLIYLTETDIENIGRKTGLDLVNLWIRSMSMMADACMLMIKDQRSYWISQSCRARRIQHAYSTRMVAPSTRIDPGLAGSFPFEWKRNQRLKTISS